MTHPFRREKPCQDGSRVGNLPEVSPRCWEKPRGYPGTQKERKPLRSEIPVYLLSVKRLFSFFVVVLAVLHARQVNQFGLHVFTGCCYGNI